MTNPPWYKNTRGEWYVIIQFILFALVLAAPPNFPHMPPWGSPWYIIAITVGFVFTVFGLFLIVAGIVFLGRNLTAVPHPKENSELVQSGPYDIVRHPIYSGLIFGAFGWALVLNGEATLIYALILLIFFDIKSRREEKWLSEKYPEYEAYKRRVKKLIPFVY